MEQDQSPFETWRAAEKEAKVLFSSWASAVAAADDSTSQLASALAAKRHIAHVTFLVAMDDAGEKSKPPTIGASRPPLRIDCLAAMSP